MTEFVDLQPAALMLADAWRSGTVITELPGAVRPRTMLQGYDIQDRMVALLGEVPVGWKLGMGSKLQKRTSGIGRSIAGRVLGSCLHRDGDTVSLSGTAPVTVELEVAYVLGRDLTLDEPPFPVLDAVREVRVAFELVLSRFKDRQAVGWPSFAADNGAFQALVLGQVVEEERLADLCRSLVVSVDGKEVARSLSGEEVTDPQGALEDLIVIARERGTTLSAGSIVSTGTVSRPFTLEGRAEITASFLGQELGFRTAPREVGAG